MGSTYCPNCGNTKGNWQMTNFGEYRCEHCPKEKPIIFSGNSVLALLNGTKTQTRRVIKPQPVEDVDPEDCTGHTYFDGTNEDGTSKCKWTKYFPGMRLWVREEWATFEDCTFEGNILGGPAYKAAWPPTLDERHDAGLLHLPDKWRNPLFMPRWASRITLEVTEVRIQRLQNISEEDAQEEGVTKVISQKIHGWTPHVLEFSLMWDEINWKKHPWKSDPYVYVITFTNVSKNT